MTDKSVTATLNELMEQGKTPEILEWVSMKVPAREILSAIDDTFPMVEYLREAGYKVED